MKKGKLKKGCIGMDRVKEILKLSEMGLSKSEISRSTGVCRGTVREYIEQAQSVGVSSETIEQLSKEEFASKFGKGCAGRKEKTGELNFEYMRNEMRRKGMTMLLLWEEYCRTASEEERYSYSHYCEKYRRWLKRHSLSMRQNFKAGERAGVDFTGMRVEIVDKETSAVSLAEIFVGSLAGSNYLYAEAVASQEMVHWIGAHQRMFEFFGGVPEVVVSDNLKSGVTTPDRYEPEINRSYQELSEHYDFVVIPARVKEPRDKSWVENAVQNVERRILAPLRNRTFFSIAELNIAVKELLYTLNTRTMQVYGKSRLELFNEIDKPALRPLPATPYCFAAWKEARVNIDYHIEVKRHYYSVPYELVHRKVDVRISEQSIEIFHDRKKVAMHLRSNQPGRHTTLKEHMPLEHRYAMDWTPSRLLEWATKIGSETKEQVKSLINSRRHPEQSYRAILGLLNLSKQYGSSRLEAACKKANELGVVSMPRIKSMLKGGFNPEAEPENLPSLQAHRNLRGNIEFH